MPQEGIIEVTPGSIVAGSSKKKSGTWCIERTSAKTLDMLKHTLSLSRQRLSGKTKKLAGLLV